jgi:hypothetical protein
VKTPPFFYLEENIMSNEKMTFTKGDLVKRTKSAELAKMLEAAGWKHEKSGASAEANKKGK